MMRSTVILIFLAIFVLMSMFYQFKDSSFFANINKGERLSDKYSDFKPDIFRFGLKSIELMRPSMKFSRLITQNKRYLKNDSLLYLKEIQKNKWNISRSLNKFAFFAKNKPSASQSWTKTFSSERAPGLKKIFAAAKDLQGNFIFVGTQFSVESNYDFLIIKCDANGNKIWEKSYDFASEEDIAADLGVDSFGNIFVIGWSSSDSDFDMVTIKYNPDGMEQWVSRQNGVDNSDDYPVDIVVDSLGNSYVTGTAYKSSSNSDILTVKYDPAGNLEWIDRFSGQTEKGNEPSQIAVTDSGTVYILGTSNNSNTNYYDFDIVLIKYSANGTKLWEKYYDGNSGDDFSHSMLIDDSNHIIIAGFTESENWVWNTCLLKYDTTGNLIWHYSYLSSDKDNVPSALAKDVQGNIYLAGMTTWNYYYMTDCSVFLHKFSPNGTKQWTNIYNSDDDNKVLSILVHSGGKLSIVGTSYNYESGENRFIASYDTSGSFLFSTTVDDSINSEYYLEVAMSDANENICLGGYYQIYGDIYAAHAINVSTTGETIWSKSFYGVNSFDVASDVVCDDQGNIYIASKSLSAQNDFDQLLLKYSPNGQLIWSKLYDSPFHKEDELKIIGIHNLDYIYGAGNCENDSSNFFVTLTKYDLFGNEIWRSFYEQHLDDEVMDMVVDKNGNSYLTCKSQTDSGEFLICTLKYDPRGNLIWQNIFNEYAEYYKKPSQLCIDDSGNVYVTGETDLPDNKSAMLTMKINPLGEQIWFHTYSTSVSYAYNYADAIAIDDSGNVFITGSCKTNYSSASIQIATIKYDISGNLKWTQFYDGDGYSSYDRGHSIKISNTGIYVAGETGSYYYRDIVILKYGWQGNLLWQKKYNYVEKDIFRDMVIDSLENLYVLGQSQSQTSEDDLVAISYDLNGRERWLFRYDAFNEHAAGISLADSNNIVVVGNSNFDNKRSEIVTIKYHQEQEDFDCLLGDVNNDSQITPDDALGIFNKYLNPSFESADYPCLLEASETNCTPDGITPSDALYVFRAYLNDLTLPLECNPETVLLSKTKTQHATKIHINHEVSDLPNELKFSISLLNTPRLEAFGFSILYSPEHIKFDRLETSHAFAKWNFLQGTESYPGYITIGGFATRPLEESDSLKLGDIYFQKLDKVNGTEKIIITKFCDDLMFCQEYLLKFNSNATNAMMMSTANIPSKYDLKQNFPNPFNSETKIIFDLPQQDHIKIDIFNSLGQYIRTLKSEDLPAGRYFIKWDGKNNQGRFATNGVYLIQISTPHFKKTIKALLLK